ncbi:insulysin [Fusarium oxysporum f. sp. raphani 54005]|uniref:Insulysin n=2 Tax=Fusarium oxysporum f. sp. raphani TaxID=96318 RepID=X0BA67_FUSOX|nr:insulysin [Fusarium oxysporum f. sp. raphani 54005]KAG7408110.1 putative zinc protease [Fusarium oxysporum f. sp. raphani]KAG7408132.1 putative zinc protease [Fusarium oxysporum f. sp. raphani]
MSHAGHEEDAGAALIPMTLLSDSLEKLSLDDRDYLVIYLDNDLEALLVHDPETDKASAVLDVNVENFSDESDIPGMTHAVEHDQPRRTTFFDISAKPANDQNPTDTNPYPLRGALDRFAQFFIEPLFLPETLDRELKAIDSENKRIFNMTPGGCIS